MNKYLALAILMVLAVACGPEPQVETVVEYETVIEYEVPQVCIDFVSTAQDVNKISSEFAHYTSDMLQIIIAQFSGELTMNQATEELRSVTEDIQALNQRLGDKIEPFNQQASECEQYHG